VTALNEPHRPRTLTEALRAMSTVELATFLELRPDLLNPIPDNIAELASRAATPESITRAMDELSIWLRTVAEALAALPDPTSVADLATILGQGRSQVAAAVQQLRERGLLWGEDQQLHLVRAVRDVFGPYPAGLAPPSARPMSSEQIDAALEACGAEARIVLERLLWSPTGAVRYADRTVTVASARSPIERLLAHQLLRPLDSETVIIPREVAWRLRAGRVTAQPIAAEAPVLTGQHRNPDLVDQAAAGAAFAILDELELLAYRLETEAHKLLRSGGLSSRDVTALTRHLGADPVHATFIIECAAAAQLVAPDSTGRLLPTHDYDEWLTCDGAQRWQLVAKGWLLAERFFARSAEDGGHTLGQEAYTRTAPSLRTTVLQLIASADPGTVLDLGQLAQAAVWHRPRLTQGSLQAEQLVQWTWREATSLGLTALGAVSSFARVALHPDQPMSAALAQLFPTPVDNFLIQNDLTAVTSGPLAYAVAAELRILADQESRGGAGVYRFSATSLRRAFDRGWSAADVQFWLEQHSTTDVPQPLRYLVDDVGRRHGSIRLGPAGCYVRMADQTQAAALLAHPAAARLGLRAVAPSVLVAAVDEEELLPLLQELGHSPGVENSAGELIVTRPPRRTGRQRAEPTSKPFPEELAEALLAQESRHEFPGQPASPTLQRRGFSNRPRTLAKSLE
jgi:Helicase conserved C-terminal domain